jgi:hypothetical protein
MQTYRLKLKNVRNIRLIDNKIKGAQNSYYCAVVMFENSLKKKKEIRF